MITTKRFHIGFICQEAGKLPAGYREEFVWQAEVGDIGKGWKLPQQSYLAQHARQYEMKYGGRWLHMLTDDYTKIRRKAMSFKTSPPEPESKPLADVLPEAYEHVPDVQETPDDHIAEKHKPNRLFEKDKDGDLPF